MAARVPSSTTVGTASVTRLAPRRPRRPPVAALGLVLVAGAALAAVSLFRAGTARVEVVVAARDLDPSRPVTPQDLRTTEASTSTSARFLSPAGAARLVGQRPQGPIPAGTPLNAAMFAATQPLAPGEVVVGAVLEAGAVPIPGLRVGDTVELIVTATNKSGGATVQDLGPARVFGISDAGGPSGKTWVSLRTASTVGAQVAQASQDGSLRLELVSR